MEQKMKQQRQAARIRRQQWTAWGASAGVLILVVGISFYFLKNPVELPLLPEDNITEEAETDEIALTEIEIKEDIYKDIHFKIA